MEFGLKWVHIIIIIMARYELILRLDGALWLPIISKTPLASRKAMEGPTNPKEFRKALLRAGLKRIQLLNSSGMCDLASSRRFFILLWMFCDSMALLGSGGVQK